MRVGETFKDRFKVYNTAGALATADTVTVTVTLPDLTTASPITPTEASTGVYDWSYTPTVAGRHEYVKRVVLGGVTRDTPPDALNVDDASTWAPLVGLAEARAFLNFDDPDDTSDDDELRRFIVAASGLVEDETHLWHRVVITAERHTPANTLWLRNEPAVSITTVQQGSTTFSASDYRLTPEGGLTAKLKDQAPPWMLSGSAEDVLVTYVAGETKVDPKVREAVLETLKDHWESQRGAAGVPLFGGGEEQQLPPVASLGLPPRAQSLLARWLKTSGIA